MKISRLFSSLFWGFTITLGVLPAISTAIAPPEMMAIRFVPPPLPPDRSAPGNRGEGASRGCTIGTRPLTALVPMERVTTEQSSNEPELTQVWGLTSQERPSFWFYVPYEPAAVQSLEFVLQDEQEETLYRSEIPIPEQSGMVSVTLPPTAPTLIEGKAYHWFFKAKTKCATQQTPTLSYVEGWVQRQALSPALRERLQQALPQEQAELYAQNGIWYDALHSVAERWRLNPTDTALVQEWRELLGAIGLADLVDAPR
jgi:Domain of Unknown Function (DUF928)